MVGLGFSGASYVCLNLAVHHIPLLSKVRFIGSRNRLGVGLAVMVKAAVDVADPAVFLRVEIENGVF